MFSFGLAPAIGQLVSSGGLLPIGRKGEPDDSPKEVDSSAPSSLGNNSHVYIDKSI